MRRLFRELGITFEGVNCGQFSGEADFDQAGQVVQILLEREQFDGPPVNLNIADLVKERVRLRGQFGVAFLEDGGAANVLHRSKYELFMALSRRLREVFAEDIQEYLQSDADSPVYRSA